MLLFAELVIFGSKALGILANLVIILAKQYIVNRKLKGEALSTYAFWIQVKRQYEVEKCIAFESGKNVVELQRKWRRLTEYFATR